MEKYSKISNIKVVSTLHHGVSEVIFNKFITVPLTNGRRVGRKLTINNKWPHEATPCLYIYFYLCNYGVCDLSPCLFIRQIAIGYPTASFAIMEYFVK